MKYLNSPGFVLVFPNKCGQTWVFPVHTMSGVAVTQLQPLSQDDFGFWL